MENKLNVFQLINTKFLKPKTIEWLEKSVDAFLIHEQVPVEGSVLYCNLALAFEHTGIYVGNNQVVHLDGDGSIKLVGLREFVNRLGGNNPSFSIFCAVDEDGRSFGNEEVAKRAMRMVGLRRKYNVVTDNCHRFTGFCLTGDNDACTLFSELELMLNMRHGVVGWRAINMA